MTSVAPMPIIAPGSADIGRPGQQLLPGYVVKLLKTLKIPFGTDRTMNGVDVDPSINLIGHIIDCLGALRDVNKVYRAKGSLASRSVGTRTMFGFTAELGNILLDAITFDPPNDLSDSSIYYGQVATSILNVFPEIAAQVTPSTGKVLIHHTALKASATMAMESIKMVIKAFPAGAWTTDRTGALPLHWITHNSYCTSEMINYLINANPKGPWVADCDGYLPLHWAVNQDMPNIDVVAALIAANVSASAKACLKGSLPLHWCVNRDVPNMAVLRALLQVHADGVRTFDKTGWLPLHQCVNRSNISLDALNLMIELYPQGLQCPNVNGQLPLHRALDQLSPSVEACHMMLEAFPGGAKVADDEGYLPIHLALDCARPNPVIAKMLLEQYPEAAFHKSKDGLLPIHCIISSMNPVVEIIQYLLVIFPDSTESMAVDVIPVDESADPETWTGEWIEKRWTPLSRAIDRGLDAIVILFRDALNASKNYAMVTGQQQNGQGGAPNATGGSKYNTATPKQLQAQSRPPINAASPTIQRGPSTSSNEGGANAAINRLVLGGNLDSPTHGGEGLEDDGFDANIGEYVGAPPSGSPSQGRQLPVNVNNPNASGHNIRPHGLQEGSISNGPMSHRPSTGGPPLGQNPYGSMPSLKDRGPVARGDKHADAKHRSDRGDRGDRERDRERRESGDRRDRDRDRDRRDDRDRDERRRHRSSSRNHRDRDRDRDSRYYDEDRDRHRSSNRSASKDRRRDSRDSERDHDRDSRRSDRDRDRGDRESRGHRGAPTQPRIYEQGDYDDYPNEGNEESHSYQNSQQQPPQQQYGENVSSKMRLMSAPIGPPSSAPPASLLQAAQAGGAAGGRPYTRRGPDDQPVPAVPNNNNYVGGNQINHSGSRDHFSRDNSNELGEYVDTTVVDMRGGHGGPPMDHIAHRPLSIDDIV